MYAFDFHQPSSVAQAKDLLQSREDGKLIAGGQTLLPTLKQRLAQPSDLIDLKAIADLSGIKVTDTEVEIGALTRHVAVATSSEVSRAIPALSELAGLIGDPQVRNRGTLGGSVANADPAADYPAAVLGLNATVVTDRREISADDFFLGLFETALADDEILTAIRFRRPNRAAYMKFPNPASRYAIVGVLVAQFDGEIRVAVTGAGSCAYRLAQMESALATQFAPEAIESIAVASAELNEDIHASAEYRAHLVNVMARRAVSKCLDEAA